MKHFGLELKIYLNKSVKTFIFFKHFLIFCLLLNKLSNILVTFVYNNGILIIGDD